MKKTTGFDFTPQDDGNVLIEFYGADFQTITAVELHHDVLRRLETVAHLTRLLIEEGDQAVVEYAERRNPRIDIVALWIGGQQRAIDDLRVADKTEWRRRREEALDGQWGVAG